MATKLTPNQVEALRRLSEGWELYEFTGKSSRGHLWRRTTEKDKSNWSDKGNSYKMEGAHSPMTYRWLKRNGLVYCVSSERAVGAIWQISIQGKAIWGRYQEEQSNAR